MGDDPYEDVIDIMDYLKSGKRLRQPEYANVEMFVYHLHSLKYFNTIHDLKVMNERHSPIATPSSCELRFCKSFLSFRRALMMSCWCEQRNMRPSFNQILYTLAKILNSGSTEKGYIESVTTSVPSRYVRL